MSWQDRGHYQRQDDFGGGGMGMGFAPPTPMVKFLLIANIVMFVITSITGAGKHDGYYFPGSGTIGSFLALSYVGIETFLMPWKLITYQFLHGNVTHILFNMLGVYFFGPPLERFWGSKRFLSFYLFCGVVGGLAYLALSAMLGNISPIIGASGAVLGLLTACALMFPQMIIILVLFPVPIRFAAILLALIYGLNVLNTRDLADACHLAGMVAAVLWIKSSPMWQNLMRKSQQNRRERQVQQEEDDKRKIDTILSKVHREGIQSLTWYEKRLLRSATERQKQRDKHGL
jgi:membrane associated rhomboid family serine protease